MKKALILLVPILSTNLLFAQTATAPAAGNGSSGSPYQIASLENLYWLSASDVVVPSPNHLTRFAAYYIQTADIDASATSGWAGGGWTPIGTGWVPFTGHYNGQGHTISGLYISRFLSGDPIGWQGLFGCVAGATIENVGVVNVNFSITGNPKNFGGLAGEAYASSTLSNCYSTGSISGTYLNVGGLVGNVSSSTLNNCYSTCIISGTSNIIGGLVGILSSGTVSNCYSTGSVTGTGNIGGLVGNNSGTVSNSFWDTETSGQPTSAGGAGKTTAEMKQAGTYLSAGWNFTLTGNLWAINGTNNSGYPFLRWQGYTPSHVWLGTSTADWATSGNWSENSVPSAVKNVIIPDVTNDPIIATTGTASCNNLTVESNASLTIQSDANNNGSLIVSGTSSGNITYNRYITGVDKWHLISSPVGGQSLNTFVTTGANAIATQSPKYGLAPYDNSIPGWAHYTTSTIGSAGSFTAGKGYEVLRTEATGSVAFTGTVATSDVSIPITKNTNGWNLVGNPFTSAINGNDDAHATNNFISVNTAALDDAYEAIYVWDAATSSYLTVNHVYLGGSGTAFYIAPGQAFFVYSVAGGATANFTEAMQTHQTGNIFKSGSVPAPSIKLIAERKEGTTSTNILYINNMTTGLDPGYDAGRFSGGDNSFAIYTHLVGDSTNLVDFDIQCLPANEFNHIIPVGLNAPAGSEVVFRAEATNLPAGVLVYLEDRVAGKYIALQEPGSFYSVKLSEKSQGTSRFFLHTQASATGIDPLANEAGFTIITRPQYNSIRVIGNLGSSPQIAVYDLAGRKLLYRRLNSTEINDVEMGGLKSGVYVILISSSTQKASKKISWIRN